MIGRLIRLAVVGGILGGFLDRWLERRALFAGRIEPGAIRTAIEIDAPIETVWAELADLERQPQWMTDLKSVRLLTRPPLGVGSRADGKVRVLGLSVPDPVTITEFEPPHRYGVQHTGPIGGRGLIELVERAGGGTTVTWQEILVAPMLPYLFAALAGPILGRVFQADLERLKRRVEERAGAGVGLPAVTEA